MRFLFLVVPCLSMLAACSPDSSSKAAVSPPLGQDAFGVSANRLQRVFSAGFVTDACSENLPPDRPRLVLVVSARTCLGCRDVGFIAREMVKIGLSQRLGFVVATTPADAKPVCMYLKQERVTASVVAVEEAGFPNDQSSDGVIMLLSSTGVDWHARIGRDSSGARLDALERQIRKRGAQQ